MICSREIDDLDPYVAPNVRIGETMCAAIGIPIGFACTYRDQEYQTWLNKQGKAPARVTFHGKRLAFDIYIKIPGRAYDTSLYPPVAEIFKRIGFSWMWDIAHNEMCHFQWDANRAFRNADILAGRLPPPMPLYKGDDFDMYIEDIAKKAGTTPAKVVDALAAYVKYANTIEDKWEDDAVQKLKKDGIIGSDHPGNAPVFWGEFAVVVDKIKK